MTCVMRRPLPLGAFDAIETRVADRRLEYTRAALETRIATESELISRPLGVLPNQLRLVRCEMLDRIARHRGPTVPECDGDVA